MPENRDLGRRKPRKPAVGITPLPSLPKWADPWERRVDLGSLRARKSYFQTLRRLAEDERHDGEVPSIDSRKIEELISGFDLDQSRCDRLADDARLVAEWYLAPELEKRVRLDHARYFGELEQAAEFAEAFAALLDVSAVELEQIVNSVVPSRANDEDLDLLSLKRQLNQFVRRARTALDERSGAGRKKDARRNGALALIAWAVEDAINEEVTFTRPEQGDWRFTNRAGEFVRDFMRILGWPNERVLVGAFDKIRRRSA